MGQYTAAVQQLYVAYFHRPADAVGLRFWEGVAAANGGNTAAISAAFAGSAEYKAEFANKSAADTVNQVYMNLFGRGAETEGLLYWAAKLTAGDLTIDNIVTAIAKGANGTDLDAYNAKVSAATVFTNGLDTAVEVLAYEKAKGQEAGKSFISGVTNADSLAAATAGLDATITNIVNVINDDAQQGGTYTLTAGIDKFTAMGGRDTFVANAIASTGQTLSSFDNLDGGAGNDSLVLTSATNAAVTLPTSASVKNIEMATLTGDNSISGDVSGWTGLTELTIGANGSATITAASTTAVTASVSAQAGNAIAFNGGSNVSVTATGSTGGGSISVGTSSAPTGTITVSSTSAPANNAVMPDINVVGGTAISITQAHAHALKSTQTNGTVSVTGGAATKSVVVKNSAQATASATVAGVNVNSVAITDVNGGTKTAGVITSVSVDGYSSLGIMNNALTTLSVANGTGNIIIDNSGLASPTNKTLALTVNALTGGTLDDADIYTKVNVTTTGANSTLANMTLGAATELTVAGTKALTLTSAAGLSKLATVSVSGSAGLTADLSGATVTSVDATATSGAVTVTIDSSKATYKGGSGVDKVSSSAAATKTISLGAGDDSLTLTSGTAPTAAIDGGVGTDVLSLTAALAATSSGDAKFAGLVTGFESLVLTGATNQTIELDVLGNFSAVSTSGGNGLTLNAMPTGGTLTLTGAGTAYTVANSAFTAGKTDALNLKLTDASGAGVAFASTGITAANVESIAITNTDAQEEATGTFFNTLTILGNSATSITVGGTAGLALTAADTALTTLDASGISMGGFQWTSGALTAAATVKGSATGANTVNLTAATKGITYTGGTGNDIVTVANAVANTLTLGEGNNTVNGGGASGANTITAGKGDDTVTLGAGKNHVTLGDGANAFTATGGDNTYVGGAGVDTVTLGGGLNSVTLGAGNDVVIISAAGASVNAYSTIVDPHKGVRIEFKDQGTEVFQSTKVTLAGTAVFQDYANAVVAAGGNASVNAQMGWFHFQGDTYVVQSLHDGAGTPSFQNGTDIVIKLTGTVDLAGATHSGNAITLG